MQKIGLFYASSTGNTKDAAEMIQQKMSGAEIELHDISDCSADEMNNYQYMIIGSSTWGEGELQDDWEDFFPNFENIDLSGKTVALYGLGDQDEYCDYFLNAMGTIYDKVIERGATVVGSWPTDDYDHDESTAVRDDEFVGLALDADNEFEMSAGRIESWVEQISPYFKAA